ncbi:MAG TPA: prolyl oligopeptidase family serine peptidase [Gemmatimonadaceae bacterium]|nr:prolyl oligopeptidase family serine peptidase [Gemmatimonadaceae bacterium]
MLSAPRRPRRILPAAVLVLCGTLPLPVSLAAQATTVAQYIGTPEALEITSARRADRIAWTVYDRGLRNVYTAAAPDFAPVRVTRFLEDDGTDLGQVELSDDGSVVVFVRGSAPNREGWVANPSHDPAGAERAIWAARTSGGEAWRVAEGTSPALSPDGQWVLFVRDGQIHRARVSPTPAASPLDRGDVPLIRAWGQQRDLQWSPDGSKIAFVSDRDDHSFIGVYDVRTKTLDFISPSVDFDDSPTWSPDSRHIAFLRRPGTPFGQQRQAGRGGIGNPPGPAYNPNQPGGRGFGRGGFGRGGQDDAPDGREQRPGLYRATFPGGYTLSLMVADIAACGTEAARVAHADGGCGQAREVWHNQPDDRQFPSIRSIRWADRSVIFPLDRPGDEWDRYYAIDVSGGDPTPVLLTPTDGLIEDATSAALSRDGKTFYYCTNAQDIERRHIWAVPTSGGTPTRISAGTGIETYPMPLASGRQVAVLYFNYDTPASVGLVASAGGEPRVIYPTAQPADFPQARHVMPQIVLTRAADGLEIHNQLFLPKDLKPGERRPAIIFVHGGPRRQMMPGYHYFQFYHWAYAFNQWLADQGYVVMSINYRSGIGYGNSFRQAPNTNARGNSEYQDVVAGAKYLQQRADVDPTRIGIWGLSYGGLLTSQALARNSDIFVAGVDLAGVHLYGNSLDSTALSYQSSAAAHVDTWKSPVFLVHGDDDRNVAFAQTVGLVQLLRARGIYYDLTVIPDDVHESLVHSRWVDTFTRAGAFLDRFVRRREPVPTAASGTGGR